MYDSAVKEIDEFLKRDDIENTETRTSAYYLWKLLNDKFENYYETFYGPTMEEKMRDAVYQGIDKHLLRDEYVAAFDSSSNRFYARPLYGSIHKSNYKSFDAIAFHFSKFYLGVFRFSHEKEFFCYNPNSFLEYDDYFHNLTLASTCSDNELSFTNNFYKNISGDIPKMFQVMDAYQDYCFLLDSMDTEYLSYVFKIHGWSKGGTFATTLYFNRTGRCSFSLNMDPFSYNTQLKLFYGAVWNQKDRLPIEQIAQNHSIDIIKKIPITMKDIDNEIIERIYMDSLTEAKQKHI